MKEAFMSDTIIKPLSAWPPTLEFSTPDGLPGYRVSAHVLTPERARAADGCAELLRAALFIGCAYALWQVFSPAHFALQLAVALAVFYVGNALVLRYIPGLFRQTTLIEMTTEQVGVRRRKGWVRLPRRIEHRFKHQLHDRATWVRISRHRGHSFHGIADSVSRQGGHRFTLIADSVSA
jgi:hypothetical protein